ncbi:MAG: SDR family oxidoreductase [Anaerolineales bacterium]|jgi:NAD(P)-dependent dehydrogenase (short-subunit alcohol dehydrogenase family)
METGLKGKTALVTGGASGIGRGIALVLAEEGINLAIASRNPDPEVIDEISSKGVKCVRITADVSQEEHVVRMVQEAIENLGHLDFYVNNAAWTWHQPYTKITSEAWYKTLNTNLSACMWACREVAHHMIPRRSGSIVIVGSTVRFFPAYRETSYRVSKMGLRMLMQNLAIELSPYSIRVNMVTPGHYQTRMTSGISEDIEQKMLEIIPAHRFGDVREVGNAVAFLLSDRLSGYTVGGDLVIDGGLTLNPLPLHTQEQVKSLNLVGEE